MRQGTMTPFSTFVSEFFRPVTASAVRISAKAIMLPAAAPTTPRDRIALEYKFNLRDATWNRLPNIMFDTVTLPVMKAPKAPTNGVKNGSQVVEKELVIRVIAEYIPELLFPPFIIS